MRRRNLLIGILSLTLFLSGWGGALAAAFCPHSAEKTAAMADDHSCCLLEAQKTDAHCSSSQPEKTGGAQSAPAAQENAGRFGQPATSCAHCVGRSDLPATRITAPGPNQKKQDVDPAPVAKALAPLVASFAPPVAARQHAPPTASTRRHLLVSVFII